MLQINASKNIYANILNKKLIEQFKAENLMYFVNKGDEKNDKIFDNICKSDSSFQVI